MAEIQNPVVVIPGITATSLNDEYPFASRELWSMVFRKEYGRLSLHPDDLRYETIEPADVRVGRLFSIYDDFIGALRYELSPKADHPTPVFAFPYDWRRDLRETAAELGDFIEEVIARTRLLRHYAGYESNEQVDLVGHSMGGLLICEYLSQFGNRKRVGKIATLGTPFLGSIEAVVKLTTGMGNLSGDKPTERERETARSIPAIYQLLPTFHGGVVDPNGDDVDMLSPENWQPSIAASLAEYVRLYSVKDSKPVKRQKERAAEILESLLDLARKHRRTVGALNPSSAGVAQDRWLAVVGIGYKTRIQLTVSGLPKSPWFEISDDQYIDEWNDDKSSRRTGDATVPLLGALPPFLPEEQLVCVSPDDFSWVEVGDRTLMAAAGLHAALPTMNLVQRLVVKHYRPAFRGKVWGRRVPGATSWTPPIPKLDEV
ncbi:MAG: alpha/beta fold hydrolase [Phycisphaerales bacterium]|nr:alpha/beta fold hydrolase [Phycisphaerales bacterium]